MKNYIALLFVSLSLSFFGGGGEYDRLREFIDPALLSEGGIQYFGYTTSAGREYRVGAILIDADTNIVWGMLQDMEAMGKVLPYLDYQKVRGPNPGPAESRRGELLVEGRFKIPDFPAQYTITMSFDRAHMWRTWRTLTSDEVESYNGQGIDVLQTGGLIGDMAGFDYLEPAEGGAKTIYCYALDIRSTIPLPEFVKKSLNEDLYDQHLQSVRHRAESLPE